MELQELMALRERLEECEASGNVGYDLARMVVETLASNLDTDTLTELVIAAENELNSRG